ncbi:MAG: anthranilate phosphoribosyltransferase [Candidatus Micrarchaeia archaeon]
MGILKKLTAGQNLTEQEAGAAMEGMITGKFTPAQSAGILVALKMKGESIEEITGFAKTMRAHAVKISPKAGRLVDTVGTGGDGTRTFNISTCAAIIASSAGASIAKHGNRAVSSSSGSADVIEALGIGILKPEQVAGAIEKTRFGFMFAQYFHPAMKNIAPVRKELGIRTIFNILGPLTNPAGAKALVLGVFDKQTAGKMAKVIASLGVEHAMVVNSDGMDEIGLGKTDVFEVRGTEIKQYQLDASDYGFENRPVPTVNTAQESAQIIRDALAGKEGAARDISILNAAAAIYVAGMAGSIKEGVQLAAQAIDSGAATKKLEEIAGYKAE